MSPHPPPHQVAVKSVTTPELSFCFSLLSVSAKTVNVQAAGVGTLAAAIVRSMSVLSFFIIQ